MCAEQPQLALILLTLCMVFSIITECHELSLEIIYIAFRFAFDDTFLGQFDISTIQNLESCYD